MVVREYLLILVALVFFLVSTLSDAAIPPYSLKSNPSVRKQVAAFTQELHDDLQRAQNNSDRFRALARVSDQIRVFKETSLTQTPLDEAYMDLVLSVLDSVPRESNFHRRDCDRYENDLLNQYEPLAEDEPQEPAVKPGWNVLQSLCR